jgi:hypothetical protein
MITEHGGPVKTQEIPRVTLNDGTTIPQLGFGTLNVQPDRKSTPANGERTAEVVGLALELGYCIRHWFSSGGELVVQADGRVGPCCSPTVKRWCSAISRGSRCSMSGEVNDSGDFDEPGVSLGGNLAAHLWYKSRSGLSFRIDNESRP